MATKGLNKITQNETQDPQLVDNFCKSWVTMSEKMQAHVLEKNEWRTRRDSNP